MHFEDVPPFRIGEILEEASNALRTTGFHSLFDIPNLSIWIFKIPGDGIHEDQRQSELAELIGLYDLIGKLFVLTHKSKI